MKRSITSLLLLLALASGCTPGLSRLWEQNTGDYSQTPAVAPDGTLVTFTYDTFGGDITYTGMEPGDGAQAWSVHHEWGGPRPRSLDSDGNLIVNGRDRVFGLDPVDGSEVWSVDEPGVGYLQAVDGDTVYLVRQNQGASTDMELLAIDRQQVLWTQTLPSLIAGIAVGSDGTLFAAGSSLSARAPDGTVQWEVTLAAEATFIALAPGQVVTGLWGVGLAAFDRADGSELWTSAVQGDQEPAIAADGTMYAPGGTGLVAIDGSTGDVLWDVPVPVQPVALGGDGRLYSMAMLLENEELPELGSKMHFVVISAADGEVLWQEAQNEAVEALNYAPSFDGNRVFFGAGYSLAHVYAFGGGPGLAAGPWPRTGGDNGYSYREQ